MTDAASMFEPFPVGPAVNGRAAGSAPKDPTFRHVAPIPDDAPEPPPLTGSHRWWYRDRERRRLFSVDRHEPRREGERKQFYPLTLWQSEAGALVWKWKRPPPKSPLYRLDHLADRSDAPVIVTEGEKSADAAARLFPDHVAITSAGGSKAADKADWSLLCGRRVVIWPDHDEPGRSYASDVARLAGQTGAVSVRVVVVPSAWPTGWDLADVLPDGVTEDMVRQMAASAKPAEPAACPRVEAAHQALALSSSEGSVGSAGSRRKIDPKTWAKSQADAEPAEGFQQGSAGFQAAEKARAAWLPKGFRLRGDGSIMHEAEPDQWQWLCSPLVVEAATRNAESESWGRLIGVQDRDKVWHEWAMPMADLAGAGDVYRARLLSHGARVGTRNESPQRAASAADHRQSAGPRPVRVDAGMARRSLHAAR